jgi:hypothetical protein
MAELKTKPTKVSVTKFLERIADENRRKDCFTVLKLMKKITGEEPKMWGPSIVGFGTFHYKYASGREGDWPLTGFSPRKQNLTIYIMCGLNKNPELLKKLGKYKSTVSCLYVNKLENIDLKVLEKLIKESIKFTKKLYK